jgi:hypothetical protein
LQRNLSVAWLMFVIVERIGPHCGSVRRSCQSGVPLLLLEVD